LKQRYRIMWVQNSSGVKKEGFFHTDFIVNFTAKLKALTTITVISIHKA